MLWLNFQCDLVRRCSARTCNTNSKKQNILNILSKVHTQSKKMKYVLRLRLGCVHEITSETTTRTTKIARENWAFRATANQPKKIHAHTPKQNDSHWPYKSNAKQKRLNSSEYTNFKEYRPKIGEQKIRLKKKFLNATCLPCCSACVSLYTFFYLNLCNKMSVCHLNNKCKNKTQKTERFHKRNSKLPATTDIAL